MLAAASYITKRVRKQSYIGFNEITEYVSFNLRKVFFQLSILMLVFFEINQKHVDIGRRYSADP